MNIYTDPQELHTVSEKLKAGGLTPEKAELQMVPNQWVEVTDETVARKILNFMEALDDDQDVSEVASNFDISDELMEKLAD